jgi:hypothetical protein
MILFARSSDFSHTYPDNNASDFRISLIRRADFDASAQVGLLDLIIPPIDTEKTCYLISNICGYSQCGSSFRRVLMVLHLQPSDKSQRVVIERVNYFPLNCVDFQEIRLSLVDEKEQFLKFGKGAQTFVALEIK